jgi:hypothetical protein
MFWIIQIIIISIIFILLIDHLINFLKNTLTLPKVKDLVSSTNKKYEIIYNIINKNNKSSTIPDLNNKSLTINDLNNDVLSNDILPNDDEISMKNELKDFLKNQLIFNKELN